MSANRIGFEEDPAYRNETGFNFDADFYSLLNVPQDADLKQINRAYKQMSLTFHPDKLGQMPRFSNMPTIQKLIFKDINTAYQYLSKPLTKVIYDEFGVLGLAVYEEEKKKFIDLQEEFRIAHQDQELGDLVDEQTRAMVKRQIEESKAQVENKILNKSRQLLKEK